MGHDFEMLAGELRLGAEKMIALASSASTNPQDGVVVGREQIMLPPAETFPSQEAKNYAQAALALTQAWCTVMRAGAGGGGRPRAY